MFVIRNHFHAYLVVVGGSQHSSPTSGGLFEMMGSAAVTAATAVSNLFSTTPAVAPVTSALPPPAAGDTSGLKFVCNRCVAFSNTVRLKSEHGKGGCIYKGNDRKRDFEQWQEARAKEMAVKKKEWSCPAWIRWLRVHRPQQYRQLTITAAAKEELKL